MEKTKILIVEDEAIISKNLQMRLEKHGYIVPSAVATGEEAIKKSGEDNVDLVLMDIVLLGEIDGIEAADQIRSRFNIPVIYLTAYADETILEKAKITEPFGYIIKPFEDRELHSAIQMALYKHKMEQQLREKEKWLSTVLNSIGDAVITTNIKGNVLFINPVAEKLTGWKEEDATGRPLEEVFNIVNEKTGEDVENPVKKVLRDGAVIGLANHTMLITREGNRIPIDDSGSPIRDDKGNITGVVLVFHDITERKKIEKEIKKSKAEWEMTFDNATELIALVNKEFKITRCNKSFAEFAQKPFQEIVGNKYTDFIPFDPEQLKQTDLTTRAEIKTDTGRWLYLGCCHIQNKENEFLHTIITATDITAMKNTQHSLIESERELKKRVKDLETFYEMAISREVKMKELKSEIAKLNIKFAKDQDKK
jgi:PAS domain S-box-containing protein